MPRRSATEFAQHQQSSLATPSPRQATKSYALHAITQKAVRQAFVNWYGAARFGVSSFDFRRKSELGVWRVFEQGVPNCWKEMMVLPLDVLIEQVSYRT